MKSVQQTPKPKLTLHDLVKGLHNPPRRTSRPNPEDRITYNPFHWFLGHTLYLQHLQGVNYVIRNTPY